MEQAIKGNWDRFWKEQGKNMEWTPDDVLYSKNLERIYHTMFGPSITFILYNGKQNWLNKRIEK